VCHLLHLTQQSKYYSQLLTSNCFISKAFTIVGSYCHASFMVVSARIKVEAYTSITVAYNNSHHDSTADHSEVMKCSSCPTGNMIVAALTSNSVINCFAIDEDYCSCFDCLVSY